MPRGRAVTLVLLGAVFMSFAALLVRGLETTDGRLILAYRGLSQGIMVAFVACLIRRVTPWRFLASLDRYDALAGIAMAFAFGLYIFSLLNTSVASTLLILSIAPVFAAILAWLWLGEKPTLITCLSILLALCGVGVMVGAGFDLGRTTGNLYAIGSALCFALMLVIARSSGKPDLLGGNFLGAVLAMLAMGILAWHGTEDGLRVSRYDLLLLLAMGAFTIGLGIALVAWAAPSLPSAEVSLLILLESALSPLWVWIFIGEHMSLYEIAGGAMLVTSVAMLASMQRTR
jgi:drug/metabolite transporter (DMT)-like permease